MRFISIILGNKSDYSVMEECAKILEKFSVLHEIVVSSAHKSPARTDEYVKKAEAKGAKVFIAAAGMGAHLAGAVAAITTKPVIGVPLCEGSLDGIDALLSTVQMTEGMPVGTVSLGSLGAVNSAYLAMQILAIEDEELAAKLQEDRILKAKKIETDSMEIEVIL